MDQRDYSNELISRILKDGCQLIILWIKKRRDVLR